MVLYYLYTVVQKVMCEKSITVIITSCVSAAKLFTQEIMMKIVC